MYRSPLYELELGQEQEKTSRTVKEADPEDHRLLPSWYDSSYIVSYTIKRRDRKVSRQKIDLSTPYRFSGTIVFGHGEFALSFMSRLFSATLTWPMISTASPPFL